MGLPAVVVDVPIAPAEPWRLSPEETAIAARAVEGGLIDDLVPEYVAAGDDSRVTELNALSAARVSEVLGRPVAFPDIGYGEEGEQQGWMTKCWQPVGKALGQRPRL